MLFVPFRMFPPNKHVDSLPPSSYSAHCHTPRPLPLSDSSLYKYPTVSIAGIQTLTCTDHSSPGGKRLAK